MPAADCVLLRAAPVVLMAHTAYHNGMTCPCRLLEQCCSWSDVRSTPAVLPGISNCMAALADGLAWPLRRPARSEPAGQCLLPGDCSLDVRTACMMGACLEGCLTVRWCIYGTNGQVWVGCT